MCGRFSLFTPGEVIAQRFGLATPPALTPRWNVSPTQSVAAVTGEPAGRSFTMLRWGFVPYWMHDLSAPKPANAMVETVASKPMFRDSFRKRRCLVLADGYYDWKASDGGKRPVHFRLKSGEVFAFAALWDRWAGPEETLLTCVILTTPANPLAASVGNRMPLILPESSYDQWLDAKISEPAKLEPLLVPYPAAAMDSKVASRRLNDTKFEGPACLVPDDALDFQESRPKRAVRPTRPARPTRPPNRSTGPQQGPRSTGRSEGHGRPPSRPR